jgi:hypothetical protein
MARADSIVHVNQANIFQVQATNVNTETEIDFGRAVQFVRITNTTDNLNIDMAHVSGNVNGASCYFNPVGAVFEFESTQPLQKIYIKASGTTGKYSIIAY